MHYIHKDHLGSFQSITNEDGELVEELSFDPWGRRRNAEDWSFESVPANFTFDRGYTGHEHLDVFGLINMNGRVYDPFVARFLSPDPIIQEPENTQSHNRYSYCLNNPLKYTDPSGYSFMSGFEDVIHGLLNVVTMPARVLSEGFVWGNDQINGSPDPNGYFSLEYIVHGALPAPDAGFYNLFNESYDLSQDHGLPRAVLGHIYQISTPKNDSKIPEKDMKEEGDFNNVEWFVFYDRNAWVETPGMSFNPPTDPPDKDGEGTVKEKKGKDDPTVEIVFNIKVGLGNEEHFNILGFGLVSNQTIIGFNYMTFILNTSEGFSFRPYGGIYSKFEAGAANFYAGGSYDWYTNKRSYSGQIGSTKFEKGKSTRFTPLSFGFLFGIGFDFEVSFSQEQALEHQIELQKSFMDNLGYFPGIN